MLLSTKAAPSVKRPDLNEKQFQPRRILQLYLNLSHWEKEKEKLFPRALGRVVSFYYHFASGFATGESMKKKVSPRLYEAPGKVCAERRFVCRKEKTKRQRKSVTHRLM